MCDITVVSTMHSTESLSWKCNITLLLCSWGGLLFAWSESGKIKSLEKHHVLLLFLKQNSAIKKPFFTIKKHGTESVMLESLNPDLLM